MTLAELRAQLRLPVIVAPMFLVSGPDLTIAACKAGLMGSFPTANARTEQDLEAWLVRIEGELAAARATGVKVAPYAVNLIVHDVGSPRFLRDLVLIERFKPAVVITSVGPPGEVADRVHRYGGLVFHDISNLRHATKAAGQGVDGLILLIAGAGGHTGIANPFAFVPQVRRQFKGAIILAGCISDGRSILAAEALGAHFAYMGTRFAATKESLASDEYKALLVSQQMADIITTDRISGMTATFMRGSISRVGLDPDNLPPTEGFLKPTIPAELKGWRDIWSAGHGVGLIDDIPSVAELVDRLERDYRTAEASRPSTPSAQ
jgi:nitronate monooxygenase